MNDTDKARIFEYMDWIEPLAFDRPYTFSKERHRLDGNDIISAMNKIVEREEWGNFYAFASNALCEADQEDIFSLPRRLMQPERFFDLMGKWLEVKT